MFTLIAAFLLSCGEGCAPPAMDAPSLTRSGGDFLSAPLLAANASLAACAALCCSTAPCVAFSFNAPQPVDTCVGGSCCAKGGACCMLKGSVPPPAPNPYGAAVASGVLRGAPGPAPPFPPSADIVGAAFGAPSFWPGAGDKDGKNAGDTWPSAWAADGRLLAWDCDAHGSPMSLWDVRGDPFSGNLTPAPVGASLNPLNFSRLCGYLGKTGLHPDINIKPAGMTALPDGTLLAGVSCMNYGDDAAFNRQHNLAGFVAVSRDGGATWENGTAPGELFSRQLAAPGFISCGKASDGECLADGFLYVLLPGAFDGSAYWDNNDGVWLARVPPAAALNTSAYAFFVGFDGAGAPAWDADALQAQPVLTFANMVGENAASYHPYLKKYLMANYGFIDARGAPRPWHSEPFMTPHRTQLLLLEADKPWGPWRVFFRADDSPLAPGLYTPTFPTAFMRPPAGNVAELVMFFSCLGGDPACKYTLNWATVNLTLAPALSG
jgi:hypothetical protein